MSKGEWEVCARNSGGGVRQGLTICPFPYLHTPLNYIAEVKIRPLAACVQVECTQHLGEGGVIQDRFWPLWQDVIGLYVS
jgi:hypothetical protein